jgi:hypothetical protein
MDSNIEALQPQINRYLDGALSEEEQRQFEAQQQQSAELRELVGAYRQMRLLDRHQPLIAATTILKDLVENSPVTPDYGTYRSAFEPEGRKWKPYLILGLVALLATAGLFWWRVQDQQAANQLVLDNLQPLENFINFKPDEVFAAANGMRAYDRGDYPAAIVALETAVREEPDDNSLLLYLAVSYQLNQQPAKAQPILTTIAAGNDISAVPARWYLALNQLSLYQKTAARATLHQLINDGAYGARAKAMLEAIK